MPLILVMLLVLALVLFGRVPADGRWATDVSNFAHGPAFAVITVALTDVIRRSNAGRARPPGDYLLAVGIALALGGLVEALQALLGRDASLEDLWRDALGVLIASGILVSGDPRLRSVPHGRPIQRMGIVVAVIGTILLTAPLTVTAGAYALRNRHFPTLVDFRSPLSTYFLGVYDAVEVDRDRLPADLRARDRDDMALRVRIGSGERWALAIWEPKPDWRGHEAVSFDIANPTDGELVVRIRIRDHHEIGDRARRMIGSIRVAPRTRQTVSVQLVGSLANSPAREIDYGAVRGLIMARSPDNRASTFYLIKVWLQ